MNERAKNAIKHTGIDLVIKELSKQALSSTLRMPRHLSSEVAVIEFRNKLLNDIFGIKSDE